MTGSVVLLGLVTLTLLGYIIADSAIVYYNITNQYNSHAVQRQLGSQKFETKTLSDKQEIQLYNGMKPLKNEANVMYWRPQKVGSSTMLSILISYGFR